MAKRKRKVIIRDEMRTRYLNATYNRIRNGKSVLIAGRFGSGKSTLLESLRPKKRRVINVESLHPLPNMLASVCRQMDHEVNDSWHYHVKNLAMICEAAASIVIIIDEVNDLDDRIWLYLKRIMNAGCPVVMAGLPSVRKKLQHRHEDILSRLKVLDLAPVGLDDMKKAYPQFDADALEIIDGAAAGNMRVVDEIMDDCIDKINEKKLDRVTAEIALEFI